MDTLQDWALAYPALARLLWVIVLVLATVLVWSLFFCCWGNQSSTSPLERYLSAMEKQSKTKHQGQVMSGVRRRVLERSASEESASDLSSSTFPGDTLPWNLAKHQRVKRSKSASGDVLDPAERAVIRIAELTMLLVMNTFVHKLDYHGMF
ncbi:plectin-like isoform X1 [Labeo rohita]|uniref:Plectin-like isoform X1 n=1 Tax=Labeo rohita TaxID=84645 RepID=A0A498NQU1_LABRO|nr:plectin-like isoform X1 [Labeo rohita]